MSRHHTLAAIKQALERSRGGVDLAAKELGVTRQAVYQRISASPELSELQKSFQGQLVDLAVLQLEEFVRGGSLPAVKYVLSTLGKDRGFTERTEVSTHGHLEVDIRQKPEKELEEALQRHLGILAAQREGGLVRPDGALPEGFQATD